MDSIGFIKTYYKIVLPLSLAVVMYEEISQSTSYLNKLARKLFLGIGENAELYLSVAGGGSIGDRSDVRGQEYHDLLTLKVYTQD